ncbi:uncharacterized protein K444DRAFT_646752 [Hyaloscypha bicolor E]|uniref:VWFA domain-containing protein n=1 Tax=Hyaloscypha bicolor E TaxID=1095630 RepID=A0A2J6SRI5_9HELO|nr:uncharacterized protein K444DRAFT_646752 [Hyaloscypha bicolor E]PMD53349.1 hypothetical protein K444DRAFT_646752 [Hyaloscypha bicolor E]
MSTQSLPKLFLFTLTTILKPKPILDFAFLVATRLVYIWPRREHAVKIGRMSSLGPHGHPKRRLTGQEPQTSLTNPSHPGKNEPPPAYMPSPNAASSPTCGALLSELAVPSSSLYSPATPAVSILATIHPSGEDPYAFLTTFDTTLLIDNSGSMAGRGWREVSQALAIIAPIVSSYDNNGLDLYFMNYKSTNGGSLYEGIVAGGYRGIKRAATVTEIFARVRLQGGTPTGTRVHNILKPYLAKLETEIAVGKEMKPVNLIVLTDGVPSDDVESVLLSAAKKLDKFDVPLYQVGVQFFQVGNEEGAKEALEELDDGLSKLVEGGVRDIVDTVTWTGGSSQSEGGVGLTGDGILKAVLGAVVKRLDRRRTSGEVRRTARS